MISKLNVSLILFLGLIVMITAAPESARCTQNCSCRSLGQTTNRYSVASQLKLNWYQAYEYCRRHNMQLISLATKEKSDAIKTFLKDQGISTGRFWTSGSDLGEEGKFYWLANGQKVTFTDWAAKQPDNHTGKEHCMELIGSQPHKFVWNDMTCNTKLNFICERCNRKPVGCTKCQS